MSASIKFSTAPLLNPIKKTSRSILDAMQEVQQKSRTTPIPESIEAVRGVPVEIFLYPASKYFQARVVGRMSGTRPRLSMRTESRTAALTAAKDWYIGLLLKQAKGETLVESPNFKTVAETMFKTDQDRVDRGEHSQTTLDNDKSIYNSALALHFGTSYCKDINYAKIQGYIDWVNQRKGKKKLSTKTINNHLIVLSKILTHAVRLGYMTAKPEFPKLTQADNPRGWLTDAQYMDVRRAIDTMIKAETKVRYVPVTEELQLLTNFMLQTYLRPGDLPLLEHQHIQLKQKNGDSYLLIYATSKTNKHYSVATPAAIGLYGLIKALHPDKVAPDDYVFFPQFDSRKHAMSVMTKQFTEALKLANLKFDHAGKKRDLYSLRHTCISRAILAGIDIALVARNAGTSVDMIERFYASHLRSEMSVERFIKAIPQVQEVGSTLEDLMNAAEEEAA